MSGATHRESIVVLISGRGSNMRALIERGADPDLGYRVVGVLADRASAGGLETARGLGVPTRAIVPQKSATRLEYDTVLSAAIDEFAPSLVVLAGFMRILSPGFVDRYAGSLLNIHPSLLPRYPGLHTHRRALEARDGTHGATVHFVTAELDAGPGVIQARVAIQPGDDEDRLAARVQAVEHRIYPLAVGWYCTGRLRYAQGRAWLDGEALSAPVQLEEVEGGG